MVFTISPDETNPTPQPDAPDAATSDPGEAMHPHEMEARESADATDSSENDTPPPLILTETAIYSTDTPAINKLTFHGNGGTLFGIQFVNFLLGIITLGFYRFWGKARVRKYLYSQLELMDARFTYFGTGKELFIGWLKGMGIIIFGYLVINLLQYSLVNVLKGVHMAFMGVFYVAFLALLGFAKVGCARYRLSRSSWRGIRLSFRGTFREGIWLHVWGNLAVLLTLGMFYPFLQTRLRAYWFNNSNYGNTPFSYDGKGKDLFMPFLFAVLLALLTFGITFFWFMARLERYHWEHTKFPGMTFKSTVTGGALFHLIVGNILLFIFTIGIATPWVVTRTMNFRCKYLAFNGLPAFEKISQDAKAAQAAGEGVADYLDIDGGIFDFGII